MIPIKLRTYQQELIDKIKNELKLSKKSIVAVLGCGGGKSIIQANISKMATDKGNNVLFLVHRQELCDQIRDTFTKCNVNLNLCQIGMVQTVVRRLKNTTEPKIIITDEAHHSMANTYTKIYNYFPDAIRLGFTATPIRLGQGGLGEVFDSLVESVSTEWLIQNKFLAPYKYYSVKLADTSKLHTKMGDYVNKEVAELMEQGKIYGETVKNYLDIANNKKTIVYCASIKSSIATAEEFNANGIKAKHLDGTTPTLERKQAIKDFRDGKITVLCNVDLFGEGFDVPDCECVILLRPTKSLSLFIQQSMRSMRYKENKTAIIIDHIANVYTHGFPDDVREWSLDSKKKKEQSKVKVRECPICFMCLPGMAKECTECGYVFTKEEQEERETVEAELKELQKTDILRRKPHDHYRNIKTFDDMQMFQKAKGYKFAWVLHKCMELNITIPAKYDFMLRRYIS